MKLIGTLRWPCTRLAGAVVVALMVMLAFAGAAAALEQKLVAGNGVAPDNLGWSAAVDGDTAVVGVPQENGGRGAVHVFRRSGDRWTETAKLTASDGAGLDNLGRSVALDGDTIVAGAPLDDAGLNREQGSVYTFARSGAASRNQTAKLTASDGAADDNLGWSVALEGDTIVAGAHLDDAGADANQGSVYTFARSGGASRTQTAELSASDGAADDNLGWSVAVQGDTIVAGAPNHDAANSDQGSVYTFARSGAPTRTQTAELTASDGVALDSLGWSVALQGDTIVAGAPYDNAASSDQGSVYTFARNGAAARPHTAKLTASDGAALDNLGWSVALDGDTILAGAPYHDAGTNSDQGSAYTFARIGAASRTQTAKRTASDGAAADNLGWSVALDGDTIVAGAPNDDVGANANRGSASIFFAAAAKPGSGGGGSGAGGPISGIPGGGKINGTPGDNVINGTTGDDVINCGAGNDVVNGGGGDDVINCGRGNDRVSGGPGDDRINGESGRDRLSGDTGSDRVFGGGGNDRASGGSGNDRVSGGSGDDRVTGGAGRDRVSGNAGNDRAGGNSGRDRLDGGRGRDRCTGGPGPDRAKRCERRSQI